MLEGEESGIRDVGWQGEQLPSSMGKMPAFTLAKEAVQDM